MSQKHDSYDDEYLQLIVLPLLGLMVVSAAALTLPAHGWASLHARLRGETYDATIGETFQRCIEAIVSRDAPPQAAFGADAHLVPHDARFYLTFGGTAAIVLLAVVLGFAYLKDRFRPQRRSAAIWATKRDLSRIVVPHATPARPIIARDERNRLLAAEANHSTIVIGITGSGKTTGFAHPRALEHEGPALLSSVKNDLALVAFRRRSQIGPTWVYDPTNVTGLPNRIGWTPLIQCQTWGGARRAASALVSSNQPRVSTGEAAFWDGLGADLLAPILYAAALHDETMDTVLTWLQHKDYEGPRALLEQAQESPSAPQDVRNHLRRALAQHHGNHNAPGNTVGGAYSTAMRAISAYGDPSVQDCRIRDSFDPHELLTDNATLFICAPAREQAHLAPIFTALVQYTIDVAFDTALRNDGTLPRPLQIVLDEVAQTAPLPDLAGIAATAASHGIGLTTLVQSYAQLVERWGAPVAKTIWENHKARLVLPGGADPDFLGSIARLVGDTEIEQESHTTADHGTSTTASTSYRPLAAINAIRTGLDPRYDGLLLYDRVPPALVKLRPWYRDPHLTALVGDPPPGPGGHA